jgi:hypothetical protein
VNASGRKDETSSILNGYAQAARPPGQPCRPSARIDPMPILLWFLGVPGILVLILWATGIIGF